MNGLIERTVEDIKKQSMMLYKEHGAAQSFNRITDIDRDLKTIEAHIMILEKDREALIERTRKMQMIIGRLTSILSEDK